MDLLNSILKEPYAWPGGYERLLVTADGVLLCSKCVKSESHRILVDIQDGYNTGWLPVGATYEAVSAECAREAGAYTHRCDHCNREFGELGADIHDHQLVRSPHTLAVMFRVGNESELRHVSVLDAMQAHGLAYSYGVWVGTPRAWRHVRCTMRFTIADMLDALDPVEKARGVNPKDLPNRSNDLGPSGQMIPEGNQGQARA
jgi:hypothetical protein